MNIFGGILRCDIAAQGVVLGYQKKNVALPLVCECWAQMRTRERPSCGIRVSRSPLPIPWPRQRGPFAPRNEAASNVSPSFEFVLE